MNAVSNVLPSTSTDGVSTARTSKRKKINANPVKPLGRGPYHRDENGNINRPANNKNVQKNPKKS
jgi:hypothetical protein